MKRVVWFGLVLLLAGCGEQKDPCQLAWESVGDADGRLGVSEQQLDKYLEQCPGKVDVQAWKKGYQQGIARYCSPELPGRDKAKVTAMCQDGRPRVLASPPAVGAQ